jgi:hypothetical protein
MKLNLYYSWLTTPAQALITDVDNEFSENIKTNFQLFQII